MTNIRVVTACTATVAAKSAAISSSGPESPDFSSGGMPLSIAMPTSHGPASAASEETMIASGGPADRPPVRPEQVSEQHPAAPPQQRLERRGYVLDLLAGDAAPGLRLGRRAPALGAVLVRGGGRGVGAHRAIASIVIRFA